MNPWNENNKRMLELMRRILEDGQSPCAALGRPLCVECQERAEKRAS